MKINVLQHSNDTMATLHSRVVVIDVFRATTTIVTALENGAHQIIACNSIEEAVSSQQESPCFEKTLLAGEKNMIKPVDFDLGNSPLECIPEKVAGKTLFLASTNGTKAIRRCANAKKLYVCCIRNVRAVAEFLAHEKMDLTIVCSGSQGTYSSEDAVCAGLLIYHLRRFLPVQLDDLAYSFMELAIKNNAVNKALIKQSKAYKKLLHEGFLADLHFCLEESVSSVIPISSQQGVITRLI